MRRFVLLILLVLCFAPPGRMPAQGEGPARSSAPPDPARRASASVADTVAAANDPLSWSRPVFTYRPGGKRDPFESLAPEEDANEKKIKGLFNYENAVLRGVVHSDSSTYALAVDGDNYAHVLRENDTVYGGYVTRITEDAVFLHIVKYGRAMSIVLRMETSKRTMAGEESGDQFIKRPGINVAYEEGAAGFRGNISVEEVLLPSLNTKTVEEVWFGSGRQETENAALRGAYLLLSPPDGSEVMLPSVFRWTRAPQDSLYTVIIADNAAFSNPVFVKDGIRESFLLIESVAGPELQKKLYWKVVALSRNRNTIDFRNSLSFRIKKAGDRGNDNAKK